MCKLCKDPTHSPDDSLPFGIDIEFEVNKFQENLEQLQMMREVQHKMGAKDFKFADSLYDNYFARGSLTDKQWYWVKTLTERVVGQEPIYGSFDPILVMFRMTQAAKDPNKRLKRPKVRLMSAEDRFVQLNFRPGESEETKIDVYIDGWQGHGYRKFAGWIYHDRIVPYRTDRMTDDVKNVLQDLALDPLGVAKAMAHRLGVCMYCGQRLSDDRSKQAGYGPVCAKSWGLPWGK